MDRLLDINMRILTLLIISLVFYSCCSVKNYDYKHIEYQVLPKEAVNIAISDYSKRLRKRKDINNVTAVEMFICYTSTDWFYIATKPWLPILDDNGNYRIDADKYELDVLDEYIGRIPPSWIPTQFAEKDDVLYVWHDPQAVLTKEMKNILAKYDLIFYPGDLIILSTDGGDISYIFCKTNYKKKFFRKIKTPFITPLPSCGCK